MFSVKKNMVKYIMHIVIFMLLISSMSSLTGCKINKNDANKAENAYSGKKTILYEQEVELPEGYSTVISINKSENKLYAVLGDDFTAKSVYILEDSNWAKYMDFDEIFSSSEESCNYAVVSNKGKVFAQCKDKYFVIDSEKGVEEINIKLEPVDEEYKAEWAEIFDIAVGSLENSIIWATFIDDTLFVSDLNGYLYKCNDSDTFIYKSEDITGQVIDISLKENKLLALYTNGIVVYDYNSGETSDMGIEKDLVKIITDNNCHSYFFDNSDVDNGELYFECAGKIYANKDTNIQEDFLLNGNHAMNDSIIMDFVVIDREKIYTICADENTFSNRLYLYGNNIPDKKEDNVKDLSGELKVWTLKENSDVTKLVSMFNLKYPNVNVNVEVGCDASASITKSDAIKNLNTELLAGNGPDVIMLDQLDIDNYVENGCLLDLSDTVSEIETENKVFSNIIRAAKCDKGIYGLPSRFALIGQCGIKEQMKNSNDIQSWIGSLDEVEDKTLVSPYEIEVIIQNMYLKNKDSWINEKGIDREKIDEFVTYTEKLCVCTGREALNFDLMSTNIGISIDYYDVGVKYQMAYDYITSYAYQVTGMKAIANCKDGEWKLPAGGFEGTFIPTNIIGVNSKSNNIEAAKEMVKTQFDVKTLSSPSGNGMPVNIDGLKNQMTMDPGIYEPEVEYETELDDGTKCIFPKFTKADIDEAISELNKLDKPIFRDSMIMENIFDVLEDRARGNLNHEEAVNSISDKVMLYYFENE